MASPEFQERDKCNFIRGVFNFLFHCLAQLLIQSLYSHLVLIFVKLCRSYVLFHSWNAAHVAVFHGTKKIFPYQNWYHILGGAYRDEFSIMEERTINYCHYNLFNRLQVNSFFDLLKRSYSEQRIVIINSAGRILLKSFLCNII